MCKTLKCFMYVNSKKRKVTVQYTYIQCSFIHLYEMFVIYIFLLLSAVKYVIYVEYNSYILSYCEVIEII